MTRHPKAPSAGSNLRQAPGLGRIVRGAFATRRASGDASGSGASLRRVVLLGTFALAALLAPASTQAATRAILGEIPAVGGTAGGSLNNPAGVAVNTAGAGGVGAGDLYVLAGTGNNRVSEFTSAGAFVRAFGYDVVASGPDNTGANEVQKILVKASGGKFALSFGGKTTGAIGTGSWTNPVSSITLASVSNGAFAAGQVLTTNGTGIKAGTTIASVSGPSSTPTLTLSQSTEGSTAQSNKTLTGSDLPYNASAAEVEAALNGLSTIGGAGGSVSVSRAELSSTEFEYSVTFGGNLAHNDVESISTTTAGLEGTKTATVSVFTLGGGPEVCTASVGDVCKAAPEEAQNIRAGSALTVPSGIAIEQSTGNVYVYESNGRRVSVFSAKGIFEGAFGWKVKAGVEAAAELQFCTTAGTGCQAGESTGLGGGFGSSLSAPRGMAFDSSGNLYVSDSGNNRVEVFHPTVNGSGVVTGATFVKAFGYDVVKSGPDNAGTAEVQSLKVAATSGTFTLSYESQTTSALPYNASAAEVETALNVLSKINSGGGSVSVGGGPGNATGSTPYVVTFGGTLKGINVAQITVNTGGLGIAVGTQLTCAGGPAGAATISYQWLRNSAPIAGATSATYTTVAADEGKALQCQVSAANASAIPVAVATFVNTVSPFPATAPPTRATPTISGGTGGSFFFPAAKVGDTLTCAAGSWGGSPTFEYEWLRNGNAIGGFGANTPYVVQAADVPGVFQCLVRGTNAGGTILAASTNYPTEPALSPAALAATATVSSPSTATTTTEGGPTAEICVAANGDICQKGAEGVQPGEFSPTLSSLSIDASDNIFAISSSRLQKFNSSDVVVNSSFGPGTGECATNTSNANSVAVNPETGHVFVFEKRSSTTAQVCELESNGESLGAFPATAFPIFKNGEASSMAFGSAERVYAVNGGNANFPAAVYALGPVPPPSVEILPSTEVGQTSARLNGKVTVPSPGGEGFNTVYRFEVSPDNGFHWTKVPGSDVSVGSVSGTYAVHQTATELQPNANYLVRLVATTGPSATSPTETFFTLGAAPTVVEGGAGNLTSTSIKLAGTVNPNNSPTNYRFEYGTSTSYGQYSPAEFEPFLGSGGTAQAVVANLTGLKPNTAYHWRLVATNSTGKTNGEDRQFTTYEEGEGLNAASLPDNRNFELVSVANKRPVGYVNVLLPTQLGFQASDSGSRNFYPINNGVEGSTAGGLDRYIATRGESGWTSTEVTPPSLVPPLSTSVYTGHYHWYNSELTCGILESIEPLTADTPKADVEAGVINLYIRHDDGSYTLLTREEPINSTLLTESAYYEVVASTSDCSHVLFESVYRLLPEAPANSGLTRGLYEWSEGTLRLAGVRPDGSIAASFGSSLGESTTGDEGNGNALSSDGSRVFFAAKNTEAGSENGKQAVFVRKNAATTVIASKSKTATPDSGANFMMASADGSHVFFTANYGIAANGSSTGLSSCAIGESASSGKGCDLYDYNVDSNELTDLSVDSNPADTEGAGVIGVLGASNDGSYVYFAARGQLVPNFGRTYAQNAAGQGSDNVYLAHNGHLSYVGLLGGNEVARGGVRGVKALVNDHFSELTSQVSPDGRHLLFVSMMNVTGYESGGAAEAYLYSSDAGALTCVSCRPDGQPSLMAANSSPIAKKNFVGWISHQPRSMNDAGTRVFFTSQDVLAPGAVSGNQNIYEWEKGEVFLLLTGTAATANGGGSETVFYVDSSASGNDALIVTPKKLAPQDGDFASDLYDIRVDGGFPVQPSPPSCDPLEEQCQGAPTPQPPPVGVATKESGSGNPPLLEPKKHPKHKKHHRRKKSHKHKRAAKRPAHDNRRASR